VEVQFVSEMFIQYIDGGLKEIISKNIKYVSDFFRGKCLFITESNPSVPLIFPTFSG
jgi:F0F1-type ATP synthase membrane subunit a